MKTILPLAISILSFVAFGQQPSFLDGTNMVSIVFEDAGASLESKPSFLRTFLRSLNQAKPD